MLKKRFIQVALCILLVFVFLTPLAQADLVVGNTKNWQDLYLTGFYAASLDYDYAYFTSLRDANLKTQTFPQSSNIIILEHSNDPVVRNYQNFLRVRGYENVESIVFSDYTELQDILASRMDSDKALVLDSRWGMEAVAATTFMINEGFSPYFLSEDNRNTVLSDIRGKEEVLIVGHFPVRLIADFPGNKITDFPDFNANTMSLRSARTGDYNWGQISNSQRQDFSTFKSRIPNFVFNGDVQRTAQTIRNSGVRNFEVIGSEMADIATNIRGASGENLRLLLKYARTYTNIDELSGQLLDLDRVEMPYPNIGLSIVNATYYPNLNTFTLTFVNTGTMDTKIFSTIEVNGQNLGDDFAHRVLANSSFTIPYSVGDLSGAEFAILDTIYGYAEPLQRTLSTGLTANRFPVTIDKRVDDSSVELKKALFDDDNGLFYVEVESVGTSNANVIVEVLVDESALVSKPTVISGRERVVIPAPFVEIGSVIGNSYDFNVYFGEEEIVKTSSFEDVLVEEYTSLGRVITYFAIAILIAVLWILFFVFSKKKKKRK